MILALDSSAIAALAFEEPSSAWISGRMDSASHLLLSTVTVVELSMVVEARTEGRMTGLAVIESIGPELVPVDRRHASVAIDAWRRYGKGRHRARLNLGDCFSYALARIANVPLLCVRDDFSHTDLDVLRPEAPGNPVAPAP